METTFAAIGKLDMCRLLSCSEGLEHRDSILADAVGHGYSEAEAEH
jgi:hypothetical protein